MNQTILFLAIGGLLFTMDTGCNRAVEGVKHDGSALRFKVKTLQGEEVDLAKYKGKVVMIVNVASKCGYTPQYEQLQQLHEKYAEAVWRFLVFPAISSSGKNRGRKRRSGSSAE